MTESVRAFNDAPPAPLGALMPTRPRRTSPSKSKPRPEPKPGSKSSTKAQAPDAVDADLPRVSAASRRRAADILLALRDRYPDAHCELDFTTPHELLIATILSAQATDVGVNKATPGLFAAFPTPAHYARATPQDIEPYIKSIGLFRTKAKAIQSAMSTIERDFAGEVPRTMDELLTLRGVARKTANVVLSNAFGINEGVVVDTHVQRLSARFKLAPKGASVGAIERRLMALFPRDAWGELSHLLIFHGRRACKARGGLCASDDICRRYCSDAEKKKERPATIPASKPAPDRAKQPARKAAIP